jgi:hypothetical protein
MFVYFTSIQAIKLVEQNEHADTLARRRITPRYMVERIGPYLLAIAELQTVVDELQGRPTAEIGIGSLVVGAENALNVTLENAVEAIRWTQTKITPWRKQHAEVIGRLRAAEPAQNAETPPAQQEFETHLAKEFIGQVAPLMSPESSQSYIQKLLSPLHILLFSTLEIVEE